VTWSRTSVSGARAKVWFTSNAAIATFGCRIDRRPWAPCRSPFDARNLAPGRHSIYIRARDTFGQLGRPRAYTFTAG
jgi:hypothetical protein